MSPTKAAEAERFTTAEKALWAKQLARRSAKGYVAPELNDYKKSRARCPEIDRIATTKTLSTRTSAVLRPKITSKDSRRSSVWEVAVKSEQDHDAALTVGSPATSKRNALASKPFYTTVSERLVVDRFNASCAVGNTVSAPATLTWNSSRWCRNVETLLTRFQHNHPLLSLPFKSATLAGSLFRAQNSAALLPNAISQNIFAVLSQRKLCLSHRTGVSRAPTRTDYWQDETSNLLGL